MAKKGCGRDSSRDKNPKMAHYLAEKRKTGPFWGFYNDFRSRDSHNP